MEIIEYILGALLACTTLFPVFYIFYKRGGNKLFYLSSCMGVYTLIQLLLAALVLPIGILLVKVVPQLAEQDQTTYILPLLYVSDFIQEWWFIVLHPALAIWLPLAIYKRYSLFHITSTITRKMIFPR